MTVVTTPTVLVTRPRAQAGAWVERLRAAGVAARALPLIGIEPAPDAAAVDAVFADVERAASSVLVFVSPNAVAGFFEAIALVRGVAPSAVAWPADAHAAATGPGSVAALRAAGVPAECIAAPPPDAAQFDSETLWAGIAGWPWADRPVWLVRGNGGRDWLGEQLRAAGARVGVVQSYARAAPRPDGDERALLAEALEAPAAFAWLFSSSEAVDHLAALAPGADWRPARALASHPRIADRARALGFGAVADVLPTPESVAAAVRGSFG